MRIGFDLDGVLFEHIQYRGDYPRYVEQISKPMLRLDISKILENRNFTVFIITGRSKDTLMVTRKTIRSLIPTFPLDNLIIANEFDSTVIDGIFLDADVYLHYIAVRKFKYLDMLKLDYYFEDNPLILKVLDMAKSLSNYKLIDAKNGFLVNSILRYLEDLPK